MEMKDVNVKIKIKEVKEEARKLTIEEWAVYLLSENENSVYQDDAQDIVKSWGLVEFVNGLVAIFRTETIRDATPEEIIVWHILELDYACWQHPDCKTCMIGIAGVCLYEDCDSNEANNAREILKGKEVILEVI